MKYRFLTAIVLALAVATIVACGKSSPTTPSSNSPGTTTVNTPGTPGAGTGQLSVSLKDSPYSDAKALLVTISEISAHHSGGSWFTVPFTNGATQRICNLKKLEAVQDLLGTATLEAGHYTQIRLTVASAKLYFAEEPTTTGPCFADMPTMTTPPAGSKTPADINVPSGVIKLNRPFDLAAGAVLSVLLDFDGEKSVNQLGNGKYQMSPVISVVSMTQQ